jgi:hypothetical protein
VAIWPFIAKKKFTGVNPPSNYDGWISFSF